jgi:hypothetical protein
MTWPPAGLPIDFENATPQENTHPDAHNATNQTINNDIVPEINRVGALAETIGLYLPLTGGTLTGDLQVDGSVTVAAGSAADVGYGFKGADGTLARGLGMYANVANQWVRFATSGVQRLIIKDTETLVNNNLAAAGDLKVDGQTKTKTGTLADPAYSFKADTKTGIYLIPNPVQESVAIVSISANGSPAANFGDKGCSIPPVYANTVPNRANVFVDSDGALHRSTAAVFDIEESDYNELVEKVATLTAQIETLMERVDSLERSTPITADA